MAIGECGPAVCALRLFRPEDEIINFKFLECRKDDPDFVDGLSSNDQPYNGLLLCNLLHTKFDKRDLWLEHVYPCNNTAAHFQAPQTDVQDGEHTYKVHYNLDPYETMPTAFRDEKGKVRVPPPVTFASMKAQRERWDSYRKKRQEEIQEWNGKEPHEREPPWDKQHPPPLPATAPVAPLPKKAFLELHAAVCLVKHLSGAADIYDDNICDDDDLAAPVLEEVNYNKLLGWKIGSWYLDVWDMYGGEYVG